MKLNDLDTQCIDRVLAGETELFAELAGRYSGRVFSLVHGIVRSREDAEEVTQDVFLKVFTKLRSYNGKSTFSTWMYRVAYNTAVSAVRKKRERPVEIDENRILEVDDDLMESGFVRDASELSERRYDRLRDALDGLSAEERAIITLFYNDNKSIECIAEVTELSVSNVKVKLHRTRKKLHLLMSEI